MKDRMNKYHSLIEELSAVGKGRMKCSGNSMRPILPNPAICEYRKQVTYAVGDIVFCKVKGRFIDAHKITKVGADGRFMIANNHGYENGWTSTIYGKVVQARDSQENIVYTSK